MTGYGRGEERGRSNSCAAHTRKCAANASRGGMARRVRREREVASATTRGTRLEVDKKKKKMNEKNEKNEMKNEKKSIVDLQ